MTTKNKNNNKKNKICLVVFGGGYDPRAVRWLDEGLVDKVYELDLPNVVQSKRRLLLQCSQRWSQRIQDQGQCQGQGQGDNTEQSTHRLQLVAEPAVRLYHNDGQQQKESQSQPPTIWVLNKDLCLIGVDLNNDDAFDNVWTYIQSDLDRVHHHCQQQQQQQQEEWHVIFVSEAVMLYLDPGKPQRIFQQIALSDKVGGKIKSSSISSRTFLFVDRLKDATTISTIIKNEKNTNDNGQQQQEEMKNKKNGGGGGGGHSNGGSIDGDGNKKDDDDDDNETIRNERIQSNISDWLVWNGNWILDRDQFIVKRGATQHMGVAHHHRRRQNL